MGSSPIRTICFFFSSMQNHGKDFFSFEVVNCLIRLAVRTPRCGRGNPGSNPGLDILFRAPLRFQILHSTIIAR